MRRLSQAAHAIRSLGEHPFHRENPMNKIMANRREFLETVGALGVASILAGSGGARESLGAEGREKLAIDGGTPVRKDPLHSAPYGPQFYDDVEKRELIDVLESRYPFRWWGGKSKVLQFEQAYAAHLGVKHAIAVTSGTTALYTAMAALEIGPGDEVILPAWTWYADYDAVVLCGGLPVFVEIDDSFAMDPKEIEAKITPRTKAIVPSHLQGGLADMDAILEIAKKHKIRVVEDCAQCAGGKYKGKYVGTIGDMGINSFQLSKTITAGEGGAVVTSDAKLFERAVRFHDVGCLRSPYTEEFKGGVLAAFASCNFRMNEFTGAVLKGQLQKLETICSRLRANMRKLRDLIADIPRLKLRKTPDAEGDLGSTIFVDMGTHSRCERFMRAMRAEGIPSHGPGGSVILPADSRIAQKATLHPAWPSFQSPEGKAIRYGAESCPRTIDILGRHAGVIMDPNFSEEDVKDVAKAIRKVFLAMSPA
jgi:8-amino-3,8-dideoxy-alpha-D-manno-octulosonate transaminase